MVGEKGEEKRRVLHRRERWVHWESNASKGKTGCHSSKTEAQPLAAMVVEGLLKGAFNTAAPGVKGGGLQATPRAEQRLETHGCYPQSAGGDRWNITVQGTPPSVTSLHISPFHSSTPGSSTPPYRRLKAWTSSSNLLGMCSQSMYSWFLISRLTLVQIANMQWKHISMEHVQTSFPFSSFPKQYGLNNYLHSFCIKVGIISILEMI